MSDKQKFCPFSVVVVDKVPDRMFCSADCALAVVKTFYITPQGYKTYQNKFGSEPCQEIFCGLVRDD